MTLRLKPYADYRDSRLPWLGKVPTHWHVQRAKQVFEPIDIRSKLGDEELLTVSSNDGVVPRSQKKVTMFKAESYIGYKLCWPGDLVINSLWAWMKGLGFARHHGIVSSAYGVYRPKPEFTAAADFLNYLLRSVVYDWELCVRSKGIWISRLQLTDESFFDMPIVLPPPEEASAIAVFLDAQDKRIRRLIRAKRRAIELLTEQNQAVINRTVTRSLDPTVATMPSRTAFWGDVPKHWKVTKLYRVTDPNRPVMYGIVLPGPNVDEGVFIVKGGNCEPGRLSPEFLSRTTFDIESHYVRSRLCANDVVYSIRGSIGSAELVPKELAGANLTQDAARVAPGEEIHPRWLLYALRSYAFFAKLDAGALGATIRGINIRDLKRAELVVPPLQEQLEIVQHLDRELSATTKLLVRTQRELQLLAEYRTRLIADIVTGKLDVREVVSQDFVSDDIVEPLTVPEEGLETEEELVGVEEGEDAAD